VVGCGVEDGAALLFMESELEAAAVLGAVSLEPSQVPDGALLRAT